MKDDEESSLENDNFDIERNGNLMFSWIFYLYFNYFFVFLFFSLLYRRPFLVELMRLMSTAKDDMRRAIIQESLNNLDSPERNYGKKIGSSNGLSIFETEKVQNFII